MPQSHAAAAKSVALVRRGTGDLRMAGSLHTNELMQEVTATGLRTERRISHVLVMAVMLSRSTRRSKSSLIWTSSVTL